MAGWAWMRYSYAWDLTAWMPEKHGADNKNWPSGAYSSVSGTVAGHMRPYYSGHYGPETVTLRHDNIKPDRYSGYYGPQSVASRHDNIKTTSVRVPSNKGFPRGTAVPVSGRVVSYSRTAQTAFVQIDARRSPFHPASVAGLVVGAMGCFVFGLYLRAWRRERKALASEPQQDMIA